MSIDSYWLSFVVAVALPMVVALVTKQSAEGWIKSVVLLFLSALTGTLVQIQANGGTFDPKAAIVVTMVTFVTSVGTHFGLLKQINLTGSDGIIAQAVPGGLGSGGAE